MSKLQVDDIVNKDDTSSVGFSRGAVITGVATATSFDGALTGNVTGNVSGSSGSCTGDATGLTGTPDITVRNITGVAGTFSGDLNIIGTLNYEDVTNIDSIGIITARSNVSIADSIIHTGDTDTSIRFPAAGTFTINTAGSERLRIASDGDIRVGSAFSVGQAGVVTCSTVEARVPQIPQNVQASTYTLVKADAGKHINAGGNVTVNSGIFAIGDCISIFNDTTGDITIIQGSSVTLRLVADTGTGTRTLANYGLAAVLCVGSDEFVVSGGGIS